MKNAKHPLQVLVVEDSEDDATLLSLELERAGYEPNCQRVETLAAMSAALESHPWQLVIADYSLPHFSAPQALKLVKEKGLDLPFIVVSGVITDKAAVEAMKAGAHDYVMKDNLARLGPAVERELREAEVRRQRRRADEKLKVESAFRHAIENSVPSGITAVDLEGRQTYVNPAFCAMVGWSEAELVGARPPFVYWPPEEDQTITDALARVIQEDGPGTGVELRFRRHNHERFDVLFQVTPLKDSFGNVTGWVSSVSDITERKRAEIRLAAEHQITRILANAASLNDAAPGFLQVLLDALEADVGGLWLQDPKHDSLNLALMNLRQSSPGLKAFLEESRRLTFACGSAFPGRVWQERRPVWITDLSQEPHFSRRDMAARVGFRSAVGFPIQTASDFFGTLEFFTVRRLEEDLTVRNMLTAIGLEIGQFIQRRSAEEALRRAHDELEMRVQQRTADLKLANAKLQTAIAERQRLEHELLDITEKERRRIGLDLHDDLGQKLSGIALMTKGLELKLLKEGRESAEDASHIHSLVQEAMSHASELAHDLATLDPKEKDLSKALNDLAEEAGNLFDIACHFKAEGHIPPLDPHAVNQLYKIAQEAVTNAIKHGKAKRVGITLINGSDQLVLSIQNNGLPFPDLKSGSAGMGLKIMNYRANLIGASLDIRGTGARGTLVTCSMPLAAPG